MDVIAAYLHNKLEEQDIYMTLPKGLVVSAANNNKVLHILQTLYGLKHLGCGWNKDLDHSLVALGWKCLESNPCLYTMKIEGLILALIIYIDDHMIGGKNFQLVVKRKEELQVHYKMKDLSKLNYFLGISFQKRSRVRYNCLELR